MGCLWAVYGLNVQIIFKTFELVLNAAAEKHIE
mgnify:FL=1